MTKVLVAMILAALVAGCGGGDNNVKEADEVASLLRNELQAELTSESARLSEPYCITEEDRRYSCLVSLTDDDGDFQAQYLVVCDRDDPDRCRWEQEWIEPEDS